MPREWDSRHQAPVYEWSNLESVVLQPPTEASPDRVRHRLRASGELTDRYTLESLYVPGSTDTLVVAFHGALVRKDVGLPRFEWLGALRDRPEHQLFISDATLLDSDYLTLAWYIGNEHDDLSAKIARFITHVTEHLGIARTVLLGSSGGGYAALAIAPEIENSNALAFSPQTDVWKFSKGHTRNLLSSTFPGHTSEAELSSRQPHRFSLIARYQCLPHPSRFMYVQNSGDTEHVETHYKPFAESLGATGTNGQTADGYGKFVSFHYGEGHVPPPRDRLNELLDAAIADIDSSPAPAPTPERPAPMTDEPRPEWANQLLTSAKSTRWHLSASPWKVARETSAVNFLAANLNQDRFLPPIGGWSVDYSLVAAVLDAAIQEGRPVHIVELGSGSGTPWFASIAKATGGHLISAEHNPEFIAKTTALLDHYGLSETCTLVLAELVEDAHGTTWYDAAPLLAAIGDTPITTLIVDGPPNSPGAHPRSPALFALQSLLADNALVVLDDVSRDEEQQTLAAWGQQFGDRIQTIPILDGVAIFRLRGAQHAPGPPGSGDTPMDSGASNDTKE